MLISIISLLGSTVSFKWMSRRLIKPSRCLHLKFSSNETTFDVRVLKAQFILGMVDSLSDELTKAVRSTGTPQENPYTSLYDDLLSSISHRVTEDLLQPEGLQIDPCNNAADPNPFGIQKNISYSLVLIPTADIPQTIDQYPLWSAPLLPASGNKSSSIIQSIPLAVTQLELPLKVVEDDANTTMGKAAATSSIKGGADMIVSVAVRYCLPPVVAQWLPHKLPQLVMQWVHEHWF